MEDVEADDIRPIVRLEEAFHRLMGALVRGEGLSTIRPIVDANPEVLHSRPVEGPALRFACWFDASLEVVEYLYQRNPQAISARNVNGQLPFHFAIRHDSTNSVKVVKFLIKNNRTYEVDERNGDHLLHMVCGRHPETHLLKHMIDKYPDALLRRNNLGQLPLHVRTVRMRLGTLSPEEKFADLIDAIPFALLAEDSVGETPACAGYIARTDSPNYQCYLQKCEQRVRDWIKIRQNRLSDLGERRNFPDAVQQVIWTFMVPDCVPRAGGP
jgi:hypothetical protein